MGWNRIFRAELSCFETLKTLAGIFVRQVKTWDKTLGGLGTDLNAFTCGLVKRTKMWAKVWTNLGLFLSVLVGSMVHWTKAHARTQETLATIYVGLVESLVLMTKTRESSSTDLGILVVFMTAWSRLAWCGPRHHVPLWAIKIHFFLFQNDY